MNPRLHLAWKEVVVTEALTHCHGYHSEIFGCVQVVVFSARRFVRS